MLKLRNAVLTALLAFCLAMPFVSCSFNDGATGDVSDQVKEQTGNNQNDGNGDSTGGNGTTSGGDEDSGDNGNENPSGGNSGGSGENKNPATDEGTTYVVKYNGDIIKESLPESKWSNGVEKYGLVKGTDYTIDGTVINLTDSGYTKVMAAKSGAGEGGEEPGYGDEPSYDGTVYTVTLDGKPLVNEKGNAVKVPAADWDYYKTILTEGDDYTISGTTIDLTQAGYTKVLSAMSGTGSGA